MPRVRLTGGKPPLEGRALEIPPLTWHAAVTTWTSAPVVDALAALAVVGYLIAVVRRTRTAATGWPLHATVSWLAGVAVLLLSMHSSIEVYGHALLWVHMIQHLLLIMVVPILLIWGQPVRLFWGKAPGSRVLRWLTFPLLTIGLYTAVLVGTHLTGFPEAMATQPAVHHLEQLLYVVSGYLLFWPLAGAEASPWSVPHIVRFALLAVAMGADTLVGVALMLTGQPLAPGMAMMRPGWGPSPLEDQNLAGAIMWVGGDGLMMLLMLAVVAQWSAAGSRARLGDWLESARRQSLARIGSASGADYNTVGASADVDDDEEARAAYNRMLAELNRRSPPHT
ncbi:MAG TPA: cytochrome c oxidase assembly protein [Pseudonocardiaceae bacterium]|nr:cytochrome c oxidase assembly protein [Pseudonocardiaceae bacterium]